MQEIENIDFKILAGLSAEQAHKYQIIPYAWEAKAVSLFSAEGSDVAIQELEFLLGKKITVKKVPLPLFQKYLSVYYPSSSTTVKRTKVQLEEESEIIRFVRKTFEEAAAMGASDIHIERYESYARIRYRWEGQLIEKYEVPLSQYNAIVSRIKILSELDISERRLPQDGRINLNLQGNKIDVRVSTVPGKFGEKVVMRLLSRSPQFLKLDNLGMKNREKEDFSLALQHPNGIILITGPTGSGKTTTLYAALSILNQPRVNISTIEDPIEYNLEGINQVQVKDEIGLGFGNALRAFLRQDPDIIMVGEIRDKETAEIAIRAALTGHLVFSTLHTNSSWDAVTRLIDMGVEPYLIASSVRMVVAQRLLRVLCPHCKRESTQELYPKVQAQYKLEKHYEAEGCPQCHFTGYIRRKAIYEVIPITRALTEKIKQVDLEVDEYLKEQRINRLQDHVVSMIQKGETALSEGLMYLI